MAPSKKVEGGQTPRTSFRFRPKVRVLIKELADDTEMNMTQYLEQLVMSAARKAGKVSRKDQADGSREG